MTASRSRIGYLDGIRGIAVIAVVASHVVAGRSHWFTGGYIGVDLFFVLSGFVITGLLVRRRESYLTFLRRRVRRLYPPLLAVVAVGVTAVLLLPAGPVSATGAGSNALVVVGQLGSLTRAAGGSVLDPFGHTWSLSVEWCFYLVWPLGLAVVVRRPALRIAALTTGLAVGLYLVAARTMTATAFYFSPLAHSAELLAGAALALALTHVRARPRWAPPPALGVGAATALTVVALIAVSRVGHDTAAYRVWILPVTTAAAVVLITAGRWWPEGAAIGLLEQRHLQAIGRASYSIYLWHYPVLTLVRTDYLPLTTLQCAALVVALTAGLSWASYQLLERGVSRPAVRPRASRPVSVG